MSIAKIFAPCIRKDDISPVQNTSNGQQDPEIFGWRVNPPLKSKSSIPWQDTQVNSPSKKTTKIKQNQSFDMEQSWLTTVGTTGRSEKLSPFIPRINPIQHVILVQRISVPSTSTKLKTVSVQMHSEPKILIMSMQWYLVK